MSVRRTIGLGRGFHTPNSGSDQFEEGSENNKEGGGRCFFIQNNTWLNENHAPGKQHACNDSGSD